MLHNVKEQRRTLNHFVSLSTVISGVPLFWKYEGDQQLETKVVGASGTHTCSKDSSNQGTVRTILLCFEAPVAVFSKCKKNFL